MCKIIKTTPLNEAKTVSIAALHLQRKKRATVIQLYVCCHHGIGKPMKTLDTQVVHVVLKEVNMLFPNIFQF
jgi:hypothetical protein